MGIIDRLRQELIDIIEWPEQSGSVLVQRFERFEREIKNGAKLIVRPGQRAVFVNEGRLADTFTPGTHTLETQNLPILATLLGWKYGFHSPFKAEVYFVNATELLDRKWGTPSPVLMRDPDFGMIRLRARGNYAFKVGEAPDLLSRFVGARQVFTLEDMEGQLRTVIVSGLSDALGEARIPTLELLSQYDELSAALKAKLAAAFAGLGLELLSFTVENISVPDEVQKAIDERSSMGALGNLNRYAQYQAANAMRDAAQNPGGAGNMMGMLVGGQLAGGLGSVLHQDAGAGAPAAATACPKCSQPVAAGAKFCPGCGATAAVAAPAGACVKCQAAVPAGAKFCPACGAPQQAACVKCGANLAAGARFCAQIAVAAASPKPKAERRPRSASAALTLVP